MKKFLTTLLIATASASSAGVVEDSKDIRDSLITLKRGTDTLAVEYVAKEKQYDDLREDLISTFGVGRNQSDADLVDAINESQTSVGAWALNQYWSDILRLAREQDNTISDLSALNPNTAVTFEEHTQIRDALANAPERVTTEVEVPTDPTWASAEKAENDSISSYTTTDLKASIDQIQSVLKSITNDVRTAGFDLGRPHWSVGGLITAYNNRGTEISNINATLQQACDILTLAQLATAPQGLQDACN